MAPPGVLRRNMENCAASLWANRNCAETWPGDGLDPEVSLVLRYGESSEQHEQSAFRHRLDE